MAEAAEKKETYTYIVHLLGGQAITIKASGYRISQPDNQVFFEDVDEKKDGQWTFFFSGIAAIHKKPPQKEVRLNPSSMAVPKRILG